MIIVMCQESFQIQKEPEGPNGLWQLASHICGLLMPNEAGTKASAVQAGIVEWYDMHISFLVTWTKEEKIFMKNSLWGMKLSFFVFF